MRNQLGKDLYDGLVAFYYSSGSGSGSGESRFAGLLPYVQRPLANLALAEYVDVGQLEIETAGVRVNTSDGHKSAYSWQVENVQNYFLKHGWDAIEQLLQYLEEHLATFPEWRQSEGFTISREHFIQTTAEFSKYVKIAGSRRTFQALWPFMWEAQETQIRAQLGTDYFIELQERFRSVQEGSGSGAGDGTGNQLNADDRAVLDLLRPALAHLTIAEAVASLPLMISAEGIHLTTKMGTTENAQEKKKAPENLMRATQRRHETTGKGWLKKLKSYLNKNASSTRYTTYFESDAYTDTSTTQDSDDLTVCSML